MPLLVFISGIDCNITIFIFFFKVIDTNFFPNEPVPPVIKIFMNYSFINL